MKYVEIANFIEKIITMPSYLLPNEMNKPTGILKMVISDLFDKDFEDDTFVKTLSIHTSGNSIYCFVTKEQIDGHMKCIVSLYNSVPTLFILMDNYIYDTTSSDKDKFNILLDLCKYICNIIRFDQINMEYDIIKPIRILKNSAPYVIAIYVWWRTISVSSLDDCIENILEIVKDNVEISKKVKDIEIAITGAINLGYYDEKIIELLLDNNFIYSIIEYDKEVK